MLETLLALDGAILLWIQENLRADWLTPVMLAVTRTGNAGMIWILLSAVLLCFRRTRKAGLAGLLGLLFSLILNNLILKNAVARIRPYEVVEGLTLLSAKAKDFSFPSGHTGSSFACAAAVSLAFGTIRRDIRIEETASVPDSSLWILWSTVLTGYAVLMGFTRLYIGIHYPTDVAAGVLTGLLCGYGGYWAAVRLTAAVKRIRAH